MLSKFFWSLFLYCHTVTLYWKHWVWHCLIAALVTIGAAERQNIFTVKSAVRLNGSNKKTPNTLCGKNTRLKGWAQVNIAKWYGIILLQLQCVFILLDSLYKLWSLWWWRKIRGMTRTSPECSMYLAYSSTWSTAELNKKDNGMYLAGTRGPLTHKNHLRGSPLCLPQTLYNAPPVRQIREN